MSSHIIPPTVVACQVLDHSKLRVIARLDVKNAHLIKGVQMEGLRIVGDPFERATSYYSNGIDEIVYLDIVASLYGRSSLFDLVRKTARSVFVPITVGGGIRSVDDARAMLRSGADKIAINSAAIQDPSLITKIARQFGSQAVVVGIEAKQVGNERWEAYYNSGRERSGLDVVDWARQATSLGAGEVFVTSVDRDGSRRGFDVPLIKAISSTVAVPVIASGGFSAPQDASTVVQHGGAAAVAIADGLHFNRTSIAAIKRQLAEAGFEIR